MRTWARSIFPSTDHFWAFHSLGVNSFKLEALLDGRYVSRGLGVDTLIDGDAIEAVELHRRIAGVVGQNEGDFGLNVVLVNHKPYRSRHWRSWGLANWLRGLAACVLHMTSTTRWGRLSRPVEWDQLSLHEPSSLAVWFHIGWIILNVYKYICIYNIIITEDDEKKKACC